MLLGELRQVPALEPVTTSLTVQEGGVAGLLGCIPGKLKGYWDTWEHLSLSLKGSSTSTLQ